jgi:hypothetical protein
LSALNALNILIAEWKTQHPKVTVGTFAQAAAHGEIIFHCTSGSGAIEALKAATDADLRGKVLIDITNPLDFSKGMPPTLTVVNTDSLGEQIQRAFPSLRVVKTLNTVNTYLMVDPRQVADGDHHLFVSGNDPAAKAQVTGRPRMQRDVSWTHCTKGTIAQPSSRRDWSCSSSTLPTTFDSSPAWRARSSTTSRSKTSTSCPTATSPRW